MKGPEIQKTHLHQKSKQELRSPQCCFCVLLPSSFCSCYALVPDITPVCLLCLLQPLSAMTQHSFQKDGDFIHCSILLEILEYMAWTWENACSVHELPTVMKVVIHITSSGPFLTYFWASQLMLNFKMTSSGLFDPRKTQYTEGDEAHQVSFFSV